MRRIYVGKHQWCFIHIFYSYTTFQRTRQSHTLIIYYRIQIGEVVIFNIQNHIIIFVFGNYAVNHNFSIVSEQRNICQRNTCGVNYNGGFSDIPQRIVDRHCGRLDGKQHLRNFAYLFCLQFSINNQFTECAQHGIIIPICIELYTIANDRANQFHIVARRIEHTFQIYVHSASSNVAIQSAFV